MEAASSSWSLVGPNGEIIMDYSIHDAMEAGFNKVIFIIRRDLGKSIFKGNHRTQNRETLPVEYAYQELETFRPVMK